MEEESEPESKSLEIIPESENEENDRTNWLSTSNIDDVNITDQLTF